MAGGARLLCRDGRGQTENEKDGAHRGLLSDDVRWLVELELERFVISEFLLYSIYSVFL